VSPSTLRRYRAERLLRQEFEGLRGRVLESVRTRLRVRGVHLDGADLEACYATAWQGLYAAIAAGEEIANPAGWLTVVTFRRAIDEHRGASGREREATVGTGVESAESASRGHGWAGRAPARWASVERAASEPDMAAELDDRARLRQLFEALRSRLNARECEAAALCYLQGLTRAQAAERMGISEARMVKLMEGRGPGRPGVASKVGELLAAISGGEWCEQQGSLMRGLAFGILDPGGERYRLARLHQRECPACRAYVLSLRGLAAVLPPLPLPWSIGVQATPAPHTPGVGAKAGAGAGTVSASGAAGAASAGSAAGGGWLLGGSVGTKLAVSCVLALSVGCVAIATVPHRARPPHRDQDPSKTPAANARLADVSGTATGATALDGTFSGHPSSTATPRISAAAQTAAAHRAAARQAQREFGPEQPAATTSAGSAVQPAEVSARVASRHPAGGSTGGGSITSGELPGAAPLGEPTSQGSSSPTTTGPPSHAEREFGPE
jgi:RNA polymerase sigma factor (sigma-70 family)